MRSILRKNLCIALAAMFLGGVALGGLRVHGEEIDLAPNPGPGAHERIVEISRRIQAVLVYPDLARRHGITGVSRVRFEVGSAGRARNIELAHSSGHSALDRAARQAVVEASELPWVFGRLEVPVRFSIGNEG
jgi:TonB family protein